ncbi:diaminopimelate epimerase [Ligilactobacillus salitolerans]|uniref:Diaminopimelate epimerase n=1 Tax=Ligilactobacillus salitolerans TaxID=1808352 RepID=A0A401IQX8_9LACO|nr:diaminopimelate epimerase [Ligilactobacillus salitolerans]GBG93938.1 diaminopimelate epimerase [Ligilactobacillus salitolerans]
MVKLLKVHGSGNDFFLLDQTKLSEPLNEKEIRTLAQQMCDRKKGTTGGADGLLLVTKSNKGALARMRVINADGSEASMCGNGLRTVARYLAEKNSLTNDETFQVETMQANLQVKGAKQFADQVPAFDVEISPVSFQAADIGMHLDHAELQDTIIPELSPSLKFSAVAVPNPHLIAFVDHATLAGDQLVELGARLNSANPYFPDGVNVSFVEILAENEIFVRTYERGVGLTNACGTAMSASSLLYVMQVLGQRGLEKELRVNNPGGMVKTVVHQRENGEYWISLIGNATFVAEVTLNLKEAMQGNFASLVWQDSGEQAAYLGFAAAVEQTNK